MFEMIIFFPSSLVPDVEPIFVDHDVLGTCDV